MGAGLQEKLLGEKQARLDWTCSDPAWTHRRGPPTVTRSALRCDQGRSVTLPLPAPPWGHVFPAWPGQGPHSEQDGPVGLTPSLALPNGQDSTSKETPSICALSGWDCGLGPGVCGVRARLRSGVCGIGAGLWTGPGVCWSRAGPWGVLGSGCAMGSGWPLGCRSQAGP